MRLLIGLFVIILLASAQDYDLNNGFEYTATHNAISPNSINSSNSSLFSRIYSLEKTEAAVSGKQYWNAESSGIHFVNFSANINYSDLHSATGANVTPKMENSSSPSAWYDTAKIKVLYKPLYNPEKFGIELADDYSKLAWVSNVRVIQPSNFNSNEKNLTKSLSLNLTAWELNRVGKPIYIDQSNKPKIVVHNGESIQAAINTAAPGDIIEINSGTYNESLLINKCLIIRGVDIGGGRPIIDANGIGNAVEISVDQVILEGIVATNSSNSSISPGAGIRLSASNNCTIGGIVLYNNYYGINLVDSNSNTLSESNISNSQYGVRIYYSNNNTLERNSIRKTLNPLDIVSSESNLIRGNIFRDNSQKTKISKENEIINNDEVFSEDHNESKDFVEPNCRPRVQPSQSYGDDSGTDGDSSEWVPYVVPIDKGAEYKNLAQKAAGTLVFNPPKAMTSGVDEWIDARIGLENTTRLAQGLLGKGDIQFRNISLAMNMTYVVKLESDSGFSIVAKRPEAQILGTDPAVWLWSVTPLEVGNHTLILSVDLQLEKPPYNYRCVNVTYWPVTVKVLEPSPQQRVMDIALSSYSLSVGLIAFLASLFSLIILFKQLKDKKM